MTSLSKNKTLVITTTVDKVGDLESLTYIWLENNVKNTRLFFTPSMSDKQIEKVKFLGGVLFPSVAKKLEILLKDSTLIFFDSDEQTKRINKAFKSALDYNYNFAVNNVIVDMKKVCEKKFEQTLSSYFTFFTKDFGYKNENYDQNSDTVALHLLIEKLGVDTSKYKTAFNIDKDGDVILNFGKYSGQKIKDLYDYAKWMAEKSDLPDYIKNVFKENIKTPRQN